MFLAALNGHEYIVKFLANNGSDIHQNDNNGWTSLMIGIFYLDIKFLIYFFKSNNSFPF